MENYEEQTQANEYDNKRCSSVVVPGALAGYRRDNFFKYKYEILDRISQNYGNGNRERDAFFVANAEVFIDLLRKKILDAGTDVNGMRIYIGTRRTKQDEQDTEDKSNAGRLVLVFSPTIRKNGRNKDFSEKTYFSYRGQLGEFKNVNIERARKWVRNYQDDKLTTKRKELNDTITQNPSGQRFETKHIWFGKCKVKKLIGEIEKRGQGVGLKIRLVAYGKKSENTEHYPQQLSIDFSFTDAKGKEIDIPFGELFETLKNDFINALPERKEHILSFFSQNKFDIGTVGLIPKALINFLEGFNLSVQEKLAFLEVLDTGIPTPPPYNNDGKEDLDFM